MGCRLPAEGAGEAALGAHCCGSPAEVEVALSAHGAPVLIPGQLWGWLYQVRGSQGLEDPVQTHLCFCWGLAPGRAEAPAASLGCCCHAPAVTGASGSSEYRRGRRGRNLKHCGSNQAGGCVQKWGSGAVSGF